MAIRIQSILENKINIHFLFTLKTMYMDDTTLEYKKQFTTTNVPGYVLAYVWVCTHLEGRFGNASSNSKWSL